MSERLKELRKYLGLSRDDFAKRLGLKSRGKIENIELGRTKPDDAFIKLIEGYEIKELVRTGISGLARGFYDEESVK